MRRPVSLGASVRTTVSTSGSSGTCLHAAIGVEQNIVPVDLDGELIQLYGGVVIVLARSAVISPLMPRADNQVFLHRALADGAAGMRANSRQRMQFAGRVTDRVSILAQHNLHHRAGRKLGQRTNLHESHKSCSTMREAGG